MKLSSRVRHITKFELWRSEAEHVTTRSQRLPTTLNLYHWTRKQLFYLNNRVGDEPQRDRRVVITTTLDPAPASGMIVDLMNENGPVLADSLASDPPPPPLTDQRLPLPLSPHHQPLQR